MDYELYISSSAFLLGSFASSRSELILKLWNLRTVDWTLWAESARCKAATYTGWVVYLLIYNYV
jgi:hypothetical protein